MVDVEQIWHRAAALQSAKRNLYAAVEAQVAAGKSLEFSQAARRAEGVEGKTVADREARLRLDLQEAHGAVERAERTVREARLQHDLALIDFEAVKLEVRLLERARGAAVTAEEPG